MANQYEVDPRQAIFLKGYLDPKSETFSNALQSALRAGYSQEYSETILSKNLDWLSESVRTDSMLKKAERNLDELLDLPVEVQKIEGYGEDKELVVKTEPALVKIKADTSKFVSERLGKNRWSQRQEVTGENGGPVKVETITGMIIQHENPIYNKDTETN